MLFDFLKVNNSVSFKATEIQLAIAKSQWIKKNDNIQISNFTKLSNATMEFAMNELKGVKALAFPI